MTRLLQMLFSLLLVRPLILLVLGLNVRSRQLLPKQGPAIIIANHNSHLDTLALMSLYPLSMQNQLRPVAAMDYFMQNPLLAWFATRIIGIIPLQRSVKAGEGDPLASSVEALQRGEILILFPEGSRGKPEQLGTFKSGIAHLAKRSPETPIIPVYMHGLGMALPKGEALLVPFFCDLFVGQPLSWQGDREGFMQTLTTAMNQLTKQAGFSSWE
ncbi:MAG: lysophospholipid acyltransferase family protein [Candidatus Thiodiazotropha sp.]|jgi:1-acyl-sn-glycerol-3-phosphate acyltransferase